MDQSTANAADNALSYRIGDLVPLTGICRTSLYSLIKSGALPAKKAGRVTLVLREDVQRLLRNLPAVQKEAH